MHIYFIDHKGIPAQKIQDSREIRTQVLARGSIHYGHRATITNTRLTFLPCIAALFIRPDTIHVQGFGAALVLRLLLPFLPKTTVVWTISELPKFSRLLPYIASGFHAICTPSRTLQYRLLTIYSIKSEYIPDGYTAPVLSDIRPAVLGFRKEQYGILFTDNMTQLKQISLLYKKLKTNKKLIIFSKEQYSGIQSINLPIMSRGAQSLVRQAAFVVSVDPNYSPLALQAMDSGRHLIATTDPLHEELFGTTARYYEENDSIQLQKLLTEALKKHPTNTPAQLRARNHFSWDKVIHEYMKAYRHSKAVLVPFDSIVAKNRFQRAV